jgi:transposase
MRKIREVLRLDAAGLTDRAIAASVGSSRSTVQECLKRARAAGITWPLPEDLDERALEARLYPRAASRPGAVAVEPDFAEVARELGRKHMTRRQVWREYRKAHPTGLGYTAFCVHFRRWRATVGADVTLTQVHTPGEHVFIDYSGDPAFWVDRQTGERQEGQLFVAAWGFSHKLFAIATPTQTTQDWLIAQVAALTAFGCAPAVLVPDNASAIIKRACRYDPEFNPEYRDFAEHYSVSVQPARVRRPQDKAKVENGVLIAQRRVLAALRDATFFSLTELNAAITAIIAEINAERFQKREGTRDSVFESHERPAARPLPLRPYEYAIWYKSLVHKDHHIEVDKGYYSVPYTMVGQRVQPRIGTRIVEIFQAGALITAHARVERPYQRRTIEAHRPPEHRAYLALGFDHLLTRATKIGPHTAAVLAQSALKRKHLGETIRAANGILRLATDYSPEALELAASRALALKVYTYPALRDLIAQKQGVLELAEPPATEPLVHQNVRGAKYFH